MADALIKAWHGVFDRGTKQAQERLKKAHGHKPEFQAFLKSRGIEGGERSAKQATTSLKKATDTKVAAQKIADMRFKKALQASSDRVREMGRRRREGGEGLGGSLETTKDVIAHIKQYGSIKAGRLGEAMDRTQLIGKVAKDIEKKKAATKIVDRLKTISYGRGAGLNPAKDMKLKPSSPLKTDMSALSNKRHSMNYEEVQIDEVSKAEAEKVLGGAVKEKPKMPPGKQPAGYRYVRGLARKAMKKGMKEEVEQVVEQDDSMEKKEMAQTQLHFIKYAAEEILAFIDMGGEVEEWYQNKLSKVQSEVESLHSYIEGEKRRTGMVEEVEQIDELKKSTLKSYVKKASGEMKKAHDYHQMRYGGRDGTDQNYMKNVYPKAIAKYDRRDAGVEKAKQKLAKEEVEQVDEVSQKMVRAYRDKARDDYEDAKGSRFMSKVHGDDTSDDDKKIRKRAAGIELASAKIYGRSKVRMGEEAKQVDEVSQKMVRAYRDKAQDDLEDAKDNRAYFKAHNDNTSYEDDKIRKRTAGIKLATKKIYGGAKVRMREEVVTEAEGTVAVTPKEKSLAAHHGDPKKITYGDVIKARLKSAAAKKMGK